MSAVISIRVPDETKRDIERYGIEVSSVARKAIEEEINRRKLEEAAKAAEELGDYFSKTPEEQILQWIREDRRTR
jgi:predicted transcriptional regulator